MARMIRMENAYRMLVGIPEYQDVHGRNTDVEIIEIDW